MKKLPYIPQQGRDACAQACFSMVAKYHGRIVDPQSLVLEDTNLQGMSNLVSIQIWAQDFGLRASAVFFQIHEINELRTPAILHCRTRHFVVLEETKSDACVVMDPQHGQKIMSLELASDFFTGYAVEFYPN